MQPFQLTDASEIYEKVKPYTMTTPACVSVTVNAVRHVLRNNIPGDVVECGVWKGGSSMAMALALLEDLGTAERNGVGVYLGDLNDADLEAFKQAWDKAWKGADRRGLLFIPNPALVYPAGRRVWLYDTFTGMTRPQEIDGDRAERDYAVNPNWLEVNEETVRRNMDLTGFPRSGMTFVAGPVERTVQVVRPEQIAVLRLDSDWYASTRAELVALYPRLSPGGVLIVDDYGHWPGSKQAVDEFLGPVGELLEPAGAWGRMFIKPYYNPAG